MKSICWPLACGFALSVILTVVESSGEPFWPFPVIPFFIDVPAVISPEFNVTSNLPGCDILNQAIDRYMKVFKQLQCVPLENPDSFKPASESNKRKKIRRREPKQMDTSSNQYIVNELQIVVASQRCEDYPSETMQEAYKLTVNYPPSFTKPDTKLIASDVWGIIRGLETFSQMLYETLTNDDEIQVMINSSVIQDFPRFPHRGLLLDTARHFIPVKVLLQNLEAMAQNKLNVFHWHMVDDQSFPYESKAFPGLSAKGAFSKNHVYTQEQIAEVVEFARVRGIRVIPEFDSPGHTQSWGKDQPNLLTPCYKDGKLDGTFGPFDPINNQTYDFLTTFLGEAAKVFPDKYIHLGGDEVSFDCWQSNPDINNFMKARGISGNFWMLEQIYMQSVVDLVQKQLGKNALVWQDVIDKQVQLNNQTIVHIWKSPQKEELAKVTQAGYRTILSTCWNLDNISYGNDWAPYFNCNPQDFDGTDSQKKQVIGGVVAMWGEFVDGTQVMSRTWPRASAAAERLWSQMYTTTEFYLAIRRMEHHRCRMLKRGLRVQPPIGPGYCECDPFI